MLVGHTKFTPDWCFGLLKQKLRRAKIGCLDDLAEAVEYSAAPNVPQLAGREDGTQYVTTYDWTAYLAPHFRRISHIKKLHHFTISSDSPGKVTLKEYNDSEEVKFTMLRNGWLPSPTDLPPVVAPPGVSPECQWYLFDSIREYCPSSCRDTVCPLPTVPRPGDPSLNSSTTTPASYCCYQHHLHFLLLLFSFFLICTTSCQKASIV